MSLDPRLNACRDDLADARLRGQVRAGRYAEGLPARIVRGEVAVRRRPEPRSPVDTHYQFGETVLVFETAGGVAWCQSCRDGYVGYVEAAAVSCGAAPTPTHFVATLGSYCYDAPDLRGPVTDLLPRHAAVAVVETGLLTRGTEYARLDTGAFLPLACLSPEPPRSADLVAAAELYLGAPYLWGGRSARGIDCSGLVQNACRDLGIAVPRDTNMQRDAVGEPAPAMSVADLRRGDLVFMPGHVVIYAGGNAIVHADGASMMVRREPDFCGWLNTRHYALSELAVRRLPVADPA